MRGSERVRTDSDSRTNTRLTILNLEIRQEYRQHILRTDSFGDVTERVDSSTSNCPLVSLEEVEEFETDSHPFSC